MANHKRNIVGEFFGNFAGFIRLCMFRILSVGPIPNHLAFIMDGNRRYAKKENMKEGAGHRVGFSALVSILQYCYELGVKFVTIYAFSIENFKRQPDEVQDLMDLMLEKIEELLKEESIVKQYGIRVYLVGNLTLLSEPVRIAAEKVMDATANNTKCTLLICIAYTSSDEIVHAVQVSCNNEWQQFQSLAFSKSGGGDIEVEETKKKNGIIRNGFEETRNDEVHQPLERKTSKTSKSLTGGVEESAKKNSLAMSAAQELYENRAWMQNGTENGILPSLESEQLQGEHRPIKLVDIEKNMYMGVAPDPDILIRSSGETRLSNFLLWQSGDCMLYSPDALWPEIGLQHLVWAVLNYQRNYRYLEKKKKQL